MPFVFSHVEYCDMHFVYGFCKGNATVEEHQRRFPDQRVPSRGVEEYERRFPDRRIPSRSVFTQIHQTLHDNGSLLSVSLQSEREVV